MITKYKLFENLTEKDELIKDIKKCFEIFEENCYCSGELELDSSPSYKEDSDGIHLIENFCVDEVTVFVYGGYKNSEEIDRYTLKYEELDNDTILEILDGILFVFDSIENDEIIENMIQSEQEYNKVIDVLNIVKKYNLSLNYDYDFPPTFDEYNKMKKIKKFNL
jgi:hypothetical protein